MRKLTFGHMRLNSTHIKSDQFSAFCVSDVHTRNTQASGTDTDQLLHSYVFFMSLLGKVGRKNR